MVAASFVALAYWLAFLGVVVYLGCLVAAELERRARVRRMRERRLRRAHLDSLEPRRWTP